MVTIMTKKGKRRQKIAKQEQVMAQPLIEWTVHMARKQPVKAAIAVALIAFVLSVGWIWVHPFIAFLMALFLLNAVGEFLFPVRTSERANLM